MKTQIDLKSAACGLVIGVLAMFALGADSSSSIQVGKYQIQAVPGENGIAGFAIIIDTQTGESWGADMVHDWRNNKADQFWGAK